MFSKRVLKPIRLFCSLITVAMFRLWTGSRRAKETAKEKAVSEASRVKLAEGGRLPSRHSFPRLASLAVFSFVLSPTVASSQLSDVRLVSDQFFVWFPIKCYSISQMFDHRDSRTAYGRGTQRIISVNYLFGRPLIPYNFLKGIFTSNFRHMKNLRPSVFGLTKMLFRIPKKGQLRFSERK